ncbi:hypothetical protein BJY01DRAFT_227624 [Aspergillus pseudoustus]|uniref:Uncharacterized protein n=1 Tax=Aspergillus pseudoustus TaxID=1810923 RepID=A0ABR4IQ55_9EURO
MINTRGSSNKRHNNDNSAQPSKRETLVVRGRLREQEITCRQQQRIPPSPQRTTPVMIPATTPLQVLASSGRVHACSSSETTFTRAHTPMPLVPPVKLVTLGTVCSSPLGETKRVH